MSTSDAMDKLNKAQAKAMKEQKDETVKAAEADLRKKEKDQQDTNTKEE